LCSSYHSQREYCGIMFVVALNLHEKRHKLFFSPLGKANILNGAYPCCLYHDSMISWHLLFSLSHISMYNCYFAQRFLHIYFCPL